MLPQEWTGAKFVLAHPQVSLRELAWVANLAATPIGGSIMAGRAILALSAPLVALSLVAPTALAQTTSLLTFDDLNANLGDIYVPNGYGNLDWSSFRVENVYNYGGATGYKNAIQSTPNVAYNNGGYSATIQAPGAATFSLTDGYFGAAWDNGLQVTAFATFADGTSAYQDFTVGTSSLLQSAANGNLNAGTGYQDVAFNWTNLSSVTFVTYCDPLSCSSAGLSGQGTGAPQYTQLSIDNLTVTTNSTAAFMNPANLGTSTNWSALGTATPWLSVTGAALVLPPAPSLDAYLVNKSGANATAPTTITLDTNATLNSLNISGYSNTDAPITLIQSGNTLISGPERIGLNGWASHVQTGGSNTSSFLDIWGYGSYLLGGSGALTVNGSLVVETSYSSSSGYFQSGGTAYVAGNPPPPGLTNNAIVTSGYFSISGGTLNSAQGILVGNTGTYTQSGGAVTVNGLAASNGSFTISGGTFNSTGFYNWNTATLNASGGTLTTGVFNNYGTVNLLAGGTLNTNLGAGCTTNPPTPYCNYNDYGTTNFQGGTLDPASINIFAGAKFGGFGNVIGNMNVAGGTVVAGPGVLHISGNYSQTGGAIDFLIGSNGSGGYARTGLMFDPGNLVSVRGSTIVLDFLSGASPGALNIDNLFLSSGPAPFSTTFGGLGTVFQGDTFVYQANGGTLYDLAYNASTGGLALTNIAAVPEPDTYALLLAGLGLAAVVARRRRSLGLR